MAKMEFTVNSGPESNRFDLVFHAFVASLATDVPEDSLVKLQSTSIGILDVKTLTVWDDRVADQFCTYWRGLRAQVKR